jgi:hypothetical protein
MSIGRALPVLSVFVLSCQPDLVVDIHGTATSAVVTMKVKNTPIRPDIIQVFRAGEEVKTRDVAVCTLMRKPGAGAIRGEWAYGSEPQGYQLARCKPLTVGQGYDVEVIGAGTASLLRFLVQPDASLKVVPIPMERNVVRGVSK